MNCSHSYQSFATIFHQDIRLLLFKLLKNLDNLDFQLEH